MKNKSTETYIDRGTGKPYGIIRLHKTEHGDYYDGKFVFNYGVIVIYSQEWEPRNEKPYHTLRMDYYHLGRCYTKTINRNFPFNKRSISVQCGKYSRELIERLKLNTQKQKEQ